MPEALCLQLACVMVRLSLCTVPGMQSLNHTTYMNGLPTLMTRLSKPRQQPAEYMYATTAPH